MKTENSLWNCPRCKQDIIGVSVISKRDSNIEICLECGENEIIFDKVISEIIFPENHDATIKRMRDDEKKWLVEIKK